MLTTEYIREVQRSCSLKSDRVGPEVGLSRSEIMELINRIEERLYYQMEESGGTCFGIDMPTMLTSHPRQARVRNRLIKQFRSAHF